MNVAQPSLDKNDLTPGESDREWTFIDDHPTNIVPTIDVDEIRDESTKNTNCTTEILQNDNNFNT